MSENMVRQKSLDFALRIVKLNHFLRSEKKEFVLSKQILRPGTSIGANVEESVYAQSSLDFISKLSIALKETAETEYWLKLLTSAGYISEREYMSLFDDAESIRKLLISIVNTCKRNYYKKKGKKDDNS